MGVENYNYLLKIIIALLLSSSIFLGQDEYKIFFGGRIVTYNAIGLEKLA